MICGRCGAQAGATDAICLECGEHLLRYTPMPPVLAQRTPAPGKGTPPAAPAAGRRMVVTPVRPDAGSPARWMGPPALDGEARSGTATVSGYPEPVAFEPPSPAVPEARVRAGDETPRGHSLRRGESPPAAVALPEAEAEAPIESRPPIADRPAPPARRRSDGDGEGDGEGLRCPGCGTQFFGEPTRCRVCGAPYRPPL